MRLLRSGSTFLLMACATTIGRQDPQLVKKTDWGPRVTIRLCVLRDVTISEQRVRELVQAWQAEVQQYNLAIEVPWIQPWQRPAFMSPGIMQALDKILLEAPCDRLIAMVGRHAGDLLWSMLLTPEIFGAVDPEMPVRGYVVAEWSPSLDQLWVGGPQETMRHEGYHFLGCGHDNMLECYGRILKLKQCALSSRFDFRPAVNEHGICLLTRGEINQLAWWFNEE